MKKFTSCLLAASMLLTASSSLVMATETNKTDSGIDLKESIIRDYQDSIVDLKFNSNETRAINVKDNVSKIQTDTVKLLNNAGYYAYDVNPDTFETVETSLKTDLEAAGLNPEYSYIILVEGENDNLASRSAVSPSFSHTYNGNTYTLRWFTVYASDDPLMGKASDVNVLSSTSQTIIKNCLDAAISTYISSVSKTLGTVASICGLSISNFAPAQTATMRLNGATNWTRRYTQVWSDYDSAWANGCCVEEVTAYSFMSGSYYDASTNRYASVPENKKYDTRYSSKFNNDQWRKNYAVIGYLNSWTQWDSVGDVAYKYNGSTKITHRHNF